MLGLKSEQGNFRFIGWLFKDSLAKESTVSLPRMPTWLGIHINLIDLVLKMLWNRKIRFLIRMLLVDRFFRDVKTESESENMANLSLLCWEMYDKARSMALASAVKIEALFGNLTLAENCFSKTAQPTLQPSLEPSVYNL